MEHGGPATESTLNKRRSKIRELASKLPNWGLLRRWHITLLPLGLIALVVVFLNWGLRAKIGPDQPFDTFEFPYSETFEGTRINRWFTSGGKWTLASSALVQVEEGQEPAKIFAPHWLPDDQAYLVSVDIELSEGTQEAGINFNAQYPDIQQNHQRVYFARQGNETRLVAGSVENGFLERESVTVPSSANALRLDVLVDTNTYDVHVNGRALIEERPLSNFNGLVGLYALGGPTTFDNLTLSAIDDDFSMSATSLDTGLENNGVVGDDDVIYRSEFGTSAGSAGWTSFGGDWRLENGMLTQFDASGFDYGIAYESERFQEYRLELSLQHLEGVGGGALFNMPSPNQLNGAHMVRYSDRSEAIFWGYFDDSGEFQGQGYAAIKAPGEEPHTIKILSGESSYDVYSDNQLIASDIPLESNSGHIGLITSRSTVAFGLVEAKALLSDSRTSAVVGQEIPVEQVATATLMPEPVAAESVESVVVGTDLRDGDGNEAVAVRTVTGNAATGAAVQSEPVVSGLDINGWVPFSGRWEVEGGLLKQVDGNGFDLGIGYDNSTYQSYTLEVALRHQEGAGGGVLFNMAAPNQLAGAHMVRYSDRSDAIFWGYFDETGEFEGQGYAKVNAPGTADHIFRIESGSSTYAVYLDNQIITRDLPLVRNSGHIGLISSQSTVAFGPISTSVGGQQVTQFERPVTTGDDFFGDIRTISGDWITEGSEIRQENTATYDFSISTGVYAGRYGLSTTIGLPEDPELQDAGGGILFHMPERGNRNGAHMVRFTGRDGILWGYYDEDGSFVGQGRTELAQSNSISHTLEIAVEKDTYQIEVDGEVVALNVQLKQPEGWIGLVSYRGPITFEDVSVTLDAIQ